MNDFEIVKIIDDEISYMLTKMQNARGQISGATYGGYGDYLVGLAAIRNSYKGNGVHIVKGI